MPDMLGKRSNTDRYTRGNNVYNGTGASPNPMGNNQNNLTPLQAAAKLQRKRRAAIMNPGPMKPKAPIKNSNSLLTDRGGLYT
jgi:hypothetical protein